jgi:RHS repeat-associated protein
MKKPLVRLLILLTVIIAFGFANVSSIIIFGPRTYKRLIGKLQTVTEQFSILSGGAAPFTMIVTNGLCEKNHNHDRSHDCRDERWNTEERDERYQHNHDWKKDDDDRREREKNGQEKKYDDDHDASAMIELNGKIILGYADFKKHKDFYVIPVSILSQNTLKVTVDGKPGAFVTIQIDGTEGTSVDTTASVLSITSPTEGLLTRDSVVVVSGTVSGQSSVSVTINGIAVTVTNGTFQSKVSMQEGTNTITIVASENNKEKKHRSEKEHDDHDGKDNDQQNKTVTIVRHVIRDSIAPTLTITSPLESTITHLQSIAISGTTTDAHAVTISVNGANVSVGQSGNWTTSIALNEGSNALTVIATDAAGNTTTVVRNVRLDTQPPVCTIQSPTDSLITNLSSTTVSGTIFDSTSTTLTINGKSVSVSNGSFTSEVVLSEGINIITMSATDAAGNTTTISKTIVVDRTAPTLIVSSPLDSIITKLSSIMISGTVKDSTAITITLNAINVPVANGSFTTTIALNEGINKITIVASDAAGNTSTITRSIRLDTQPPICIIQFPSDSLITKTSSLTMSGTISDLTAITLTINGKNISIDKGMFSTVISLNEGFNNIQMIATDFVGNSTIISRSVCLDTIPPTIKITSPQNGALVYDSVITLTGTISDETGVLLFANGMAAINGSSGTFAVRVPLISGKNIIAIETTDEAGNRTDSVQTITYKPLPPDPAKVAPKVDKTTVTTLASATQFLYTGSNPIQTGVDTSVFTTVRLAVIRGKVLTRDLDPLPGVTVAILDHPEFGQTLTRKDGMYDLVVNGGGQLTVVFTKAEYLSVHRQCNAAWQQYAHVSNVIMIQQDSIVTKVVLSDSTTSVARGSVVTDQDGTRQATLLIKPGTYASIKTIHYSYQPIYTCTGKQLMKIPMDTVFQEMDTLSIRATEYTVGTNGEKCMPAPLPPASAYTYCVDFSANEAIAAGATSVIFTKPIPCYLENFLNIPVGTIVPVGYYDKERGVWIASPNGHVIKIVNTDGGIASIDLNGDDIPEVDDTLSAIGIDSIEQKELASLYKSGQTLWRVQLNHFTSVDLNFPRVIDGAGTTDAEDLSQRNQSSPIRCKTGGSIIGIQDQTLCEKIHITGTPYTLFYNTERTPGYKQNNVLTLPLTGDSLPNGLIGVIMGVEIAGRSFNTSYSPQKDLIETFLWDGKDTYGRFLQGSTSINVNIGYTYNAKYSFPADIAQSFALSGDTAILNSRTPVTVWRTWQSNVGVISANVNGMGGWNLDVHHSYDMLTQSLYGGDGTKRSAKAIGAVINSIDGTEGAGAMVVGPDGALFFAKSNLFDGGWYTTNIYNQVWKRCKNGALVLIAGTGEPGYSGDGGPAINAQLNDIEGLAIGKDGSIYISDAENNVIRRVTPDGIMSTFAGNGNSAYSGDGNLAVNAELNYPCDIAIGPEGNVYFSDNGNHCIRVVSTTGIITTFAGTGVGGYSGDGGKAKNAELDYPYGLVVDVDGTVFIADSWNACIRKITPDGIITTFAGIPCNSGYSGDGIQATKAQFWYPMHLALRSDGALYISDAGRIRLVNKERIISTVAGGGNSEDDGTLATNTRLNGTSEIAVGPEREVYILRNPPMLSDNSVESKKLLASTSSISYDEMDSYIRVITPPFPGFDLSEKIIASENGKDYYVFNSSGKHLRTVDAYTGVNLYVFGYDTNGLLSSITDRNNLKTTIKRDFEGNPKAIVSPYGQQTILLLDTTGYLGSIINPVNDTIWFTYSGDGLMKTMTDAKGSVHTFTYDTLGRLIKDEDPAGGYKTLTNLKTSNGFAVKVETALGDPAIYSVSQNSIGEQTLSTIDAQGLITSTKFGSDGSTTTQSPDGTVTTVTQAPDPRFGMQSPLFTTTVTTPSGLSSTTSQTRTVFQLQGETIVGLTDAVNINGRMYYQTFDGMQKIFASYSPEGRQSYSFLDTLGRVIQDSVPAILPTNYYYDAKGRITTITQGGRTSSLLYDSLGRVATSIDPMQHTSSFAYDALNRITQQTLPDGNKILYRYDANNNLLGLTPPEKPEHTFDYTVNDLNSQYTPPFADDSARASRYFYDLDKRLTFTYRPDGRYISVIYDTANCGCGARTSRIHSITFDRGTQTYSYDTVGRLQTVTTPESDTLVYWYDGNLLTNVTKSKTDHHGLHYYYDNNFRVTDQELWMADTSGNDYDKLSEYSYDNDGNVTGISLYDVTPDGSVPSAPAMMINHDPENGRVTGTTLGNVNSSQSYNEKGELANYEADYNGNAIFQTGIERDSLGRIITLTETEQGTTTIKKYSYDLVGRLDKVWRNDTLISTYTYDANGNRIAHITQISADRGIYDAQDRMLQYANSQYHYTSNGELQYKIVGVDTTRFTYDYFGNLITVILPSGDRIEYIIDSQSRRIGKKVNGQIVKRWIYSGQLSPVAELDSAGNVIAQFVGSLMIKNGNTYQFITDHLGSVRLVVDVNTGDVAQKIDYNEFGNVIINTDPNFQPFSYAGGLYDTQTKLTRFGARDYDASFGRWLCKDPIGFGGGVSNLFEYAVNDPINKIDPYGKQSIWHYLWEVFKEMVQDPTECGKEDVLMTPKEQREAFENWVYGRTPNLNGPLPPPGYNPFPVVPDKTKAPINPPPPKMLPPFGSLPPH